MGLRILTIAAIGLAGCRCGGTDQARAPAAPDAGPGTFRTGVIEVVIPPPDDGGLPPDAQRFRQWASKSVDLRKYGAGTTPDTVVGFAYKIGWIAVATDDGAEVARQLGLATQPVGWAVGIETAYTGAGTFISPPVEGWTLIVASAIVEADLAELERVVIELSRQHGEAQAFVTHRIFEYHGWVVAQSGTLLRSYVYDGERRGLIRDHGAPLPEEAGVPTPLPAGAPFMTPTGIIRGGEQPLPPEARHEGDVIEVAGRLGVDPRELGLQLHPTGPGLLGPVMSLER